uniref:Uncharacterized protein n=1 Tax=Cacopsylla melanoneura TaxID=428564 RepID=A0A8D8XGT0_9HEMI
MIVTKINLLVMRSTETSRSVTINTEINLLVTINTEKNLSVMISTERNLLVMISTEINRLVTINSEINRLVAINSEINRLVMINTEINLLVTINIDQLGRIWRRNIGLRNPTLVPTEKNLSAMINTGPDRITIELTKRGPLGTNIGATNHALLRPTIGLLMCPFLTRTSIDLQRNHVPLRTTNCIETINRSHLAGTIIEPINLTRTSTEPINSGTIIVRNSSHLMKTINIDKIN